MRIVKDLELSDYSYPLPDSRIAKFPPTNRDGSKILFYNKGSISHHQFPEITNLIPENSSLIFNETKVIPARLYFKKDSGAIIEIFLLSPVLPSPEINKAMISKNGCVWECMVKNLKKWKEGIILKQEIFYQKSNILLEASITNRKKNLIRFEWNDNQISFSEILESSGQVPLPPYLKRSPVPEDRFRYQTVYSRNNGAVAAPTAGLHFTNGLLETLKQKGHHTDYLTLHVSTGTFQPIKDDDILKHKMHTEQVIIKKDTIHNIMNHQGKIIPVGTTSMRTLESLYWYGVKLLLLNDEAFFINKLLPYEFNDDQLPSLEDSLRAVLDLMHEKGIDHISGETEIFIFPGYTFMVCNALITNFHMPNSTLILLVAAFIGQSWATVYKSALENDYRFLSYGDSSILIP